MTDDTALPGEPARDGDIVAEIDGVAADAAGTGAAPEASTTAEPPTPSDGGDVELLALIDRLAAILDRSDLSELEVESGGTALTLRKPSAFPAVGGAAAAVPVATTAASATSSGAATPASPDGSASGRPSVKAPLTGIFYASPTPGSAPYVKVGGDVAVGQIVGLIEAMKLFNEIKSDLAGRVVKVIPESGTLVKARQPLLEVDPL